MQSSGLVTQVSPAGASTAQRGQPSSGSNAEQRAHYAPQPSSGHCNPTREAVLDGRTCAAMRSSGLADGWDSCG